MNTKQVIVMRKDLMMRKGKIAAQAAHASMAVMTNALRGSDWVLWRGVPTTNPFPAQVTADHLKQDPVRQWFENSFTKICVSVDSLEELEEIEAAVKQYNSSMGWSPDVVPFAKITDNGATEFGGVPTVTCMAIGPWESEIVGLFTDSLPLY